MIQYTVYNTATGAPIRTGTAMTEASARLQGSGPGTSVTLVGSDPVTQMVDVTAIGIDPGVVARLPMKSGSTATSVNKTSIVANGTDTMTISAIPQNATFIVTTPKNVGIDTEPSGTVTDGSLVITTNVPGSYVVTVKFGTFLDYVVNFNAS